MCWSFGFGANLNVAHIQERKGLQILDHCAAKVADWEVTFPEGFGFAYVEPSFAAARPKKGAEIHGLAFCTSKED